MKANGRLFGVFALMLCLTMAGFTTSFADHGQRDPLGFLKRAINQANAPVLTTVQETDLNTLITNYQNAQPAELDETLETAREAFSAAILAGDLAAAQAQAAIIAGRGAELANARLQALAKFEIDVLAILKNGGQYDPLVQKLGDDRVLSLVGSLAGQGGGGPLGGPGQGGGPGHGR